MKDDNVKNNKEDSYNVYDKITFIGLLALLLIFSVNAIRLGNILNLDYSGNVNPAVGYTVNSGNNAGSNAIKDNVDVIPKGIPAIYGKDLGVSFDDVNVKNPGKADETIRKLGILDVNLNLQGKELERYINIASKISCEYCCGAESIIFSNGQPACGCAHSYAMRGLAKYLLEKHDKEYSDDQILEEMGKWKTLFFPGSISAKAVILKEKGVELNYINLASNKYRGIEQGATNGNMVGGC
ncbi:hypothetical protein J4214_01115 [Candidatus Woesearchaeota archaeon]|nr:hypothetical protein [Candidatus Woesearchaeota archaeon]